MPLTDFHSCYLAHELTKRSSSDSLEKLAGTLVHAQVEQNPHQVEAALFVFRSALSRGVLIADEVGLGKTIEAGLVISQKWAERRDGACSSSRHQVFEYVSYAKSHPLVEKFTPEQKRIIALQPYHRLPPA